MRSRRSLVAVLLPVLAAVLTATLVNPGLATAKSPTESPAKGPATATDLVHYVALGDSYTSGPLIPLQRIDPVGCFRSTDNYPGLLARRLGATLLTDVSCGGADTSHMTRRQEVPLGFNPPQFSALRSGTDLVTIGIGGNDHGVFGDVISVCPEVRSADPTGNPCQEHFTVDGVDTLKAAIADTGEAVATVLRGIRARSPEATVLLIGYPRIAPPTGTCPDILPFADGDYAWLNDIEQTLNDALATAAATTGAATFVDTYPASLGHDACAGEHAWIQGQHTDPLAAASYHPRRSGMAGIADVIHTHLTARDGS